jgi:SET domain-containing protein
MNWKFKITRKDPAKSNGFISEVSYIRDLRKEDIWLMENINKIMGYEMFKWEEIKE